MIFLHRAITFNSITLKSTQTEPIKYFFFSAQQIIFRVGGYNKNDFKKKKFFYLKNYSMRVRKSTNKKFWPQAYSVQSCNLQDLKLVFGVKCDTLSTNYILLAN